jgi:ADP-heptose:LPS heptosyltransferase
LKLIVFKRDIQADSDSELCRKGKRYIISDGFLQQIRDNFSDDVLEGIYPFVENFEKKYNGQDLTDKSVLIWRTGGMGDLCFITPNLRHIKSAYKNSKIYFGCGPRFKYGMMDHPHVDKLVTIPIDYELLEKCDYYLMFEGIIENNHQARGVNAYDLFQNAFGFSGRFSDKNPCLGVSKAHLNKQNDLLSKFLAKRGYERSKISVVGLGLRASHIIRTLPVSHIRAVAQSLASAGCVVSLIGSPSDRDVANQLGMADHPMVFHQYENSGDYRDAIAHISEIDGLIGPDSSSVHIAAAFGKPTVGIYGPFPSRLRIAYYRNCSGFDINIACGPCFLHGVETCEYSDSASKETACMHSHNPSLIAEEMLNLLSATGRAASRAPGAASGGQE